MTSLPLVTIAMVTYNSEKYIRMAIESVLSNSYRNFELIISDDCSTDKTWRIINEYNDNRIKATRNQSNLREYTNRNKCVDLANGKYILFIDGDDILKPYGLEFIVKNFEAFPNCGITVMANHYNKFLFPLELNPNQIIRNELFSKHTFLNKHMIGNLFRVDILKNFHFPIDMIAGDGYLRWEIALNYPILLIDSGFAFARKTPGQASEKLTTTRCFIQDQNTKIFFLKKAIEKKIISNDEYELLIKKVLYTNFNKVISLFKQLRFKEALTINNILNWEIGYLKKINQKILSLDPFKHYNSENLVDKDFFNSPYSIKIKNE